jgi:hypothetical protein
MTQERPRFSLEAMSATRDKFWLVLGHQYRSRVIAGQADNFGSEIKQISRRPSSRSDAYLLILTATSLTGCRQIWGQSRRVHQNNTFAKTPSQSHTRARVTRTRASCSGD